MLIALVILLGVPLFWLMVKLAKWSAPIAALFVLAVLSVGATSEKWWLVKFGAITLAFAATLFVLGDGMKDR